MIKKIKKFYRKSVAKFIVNYLQKVDKPIALRVFHHGILKEAKRQDVNTLHMTYDAEIDGETYVIKSTFEVSTLTEYYQKPIFHDLDDANENG